MEKGRRYRYVDFISCSESDFVLVCPLLLSEPAVANLLYKHCVRIAGAIICL